MNHVSPRRVLGFFVAGTAVGAVALGVAAYAMVGTDQRPFCASCHVMEEAARTHAASIHADQSCNSCHAPQALLAKLPFKAKEGLRDVIANFQGLEPPFRATGPTLEVIDRNCKACHAAANTDVASMSAKPYCVDCHRSAAHQKKTPICTREVADE